MKTFITSDLHFGHQNIFKFCPESRARYQNIESMNDLMILEWNGIVSMTDTVYILGDVAFMSAQEAVKVLNQLHGNKILIEGNHDKKLLKDNSFRKCFTEVYSYHEIRYNGTRVCMFHYPIMEFNGQHRGSVHFHGHLHGSKSGIEKYRTLDVGMDSTGKLLITMEEAIEAAMKGMIKGHQQGD